MVPAPEKIDPDNPPSFVKPPDPAGQVVPGGDIPSDEPQYGILPGEHEPETISDDASSGPV